jgi:hypothetical protein
VAVAKNHKFLEGVFSWWERGYNLAEAPPIPLLSAAALASNDPWIAIISAVEHAKRGDHQPIRGLDRWFHIDSEFFADRIAIIVTGDAGSMTDLQALEKLLLDGSDPVKAYAAEADLQAGSLWHVPAMIRAWRSVRQLADRETIGFAIADLLEGSGGPLTAKAGSAPSDPALMAKLNFPPEMIANAEEANEDDQDEPGFESLATQRFEELKAEFGSEKIVIFQGKPFGVKSLAEFMMGIATGKVPGDPSWLLLRHKFEASTGLDCSSFFRKRSFQPLAAAAILEEFLDDPDSDHYEEGRRYFYGHPIPD